MQRPRGRSVPGRHVALMAETAGSPMTPWSSSCLLAQMHLAATLFLASPWQGGHGAQPTQRSNSVVLGPCSPSVTVEMPAVPPLMRGSMRPLGELNP